MAGIKWTKEEDDFIKCNYPYKTAEWCSNYLSRSKNAVCIRARTLGVEAIGRRGCQKKRKILRVLNDKRVICLCPYHGRVVHRLYLDGTVLCNDCILWRNADRRGTRIWTDHTRHLAKLRMRERRGTPLGKYVNRLRSALRQCSVGRISFSKDLPYTADKLCEHLENIRQKQGNRCPMCGLSYGEVQDSIDHIIPISTATSRTEMLSLFALSNLSLLCLSCNSSKGAKINA